MIYCYAFHGGRENLPFRTYITGLANLLYPWARALVHARKPGHCLVAPTWPQIEYRKLLRGEVDLSRHYAGYFTALPQWCNGAQRRYHLRTGRRITEAEAASARDDEVIVFSGFDGYCDPIAHQHAYVRDTLRSITRPRHLRGLAQDFSRSISLHVRRGDFEHATPDELRAGKLNQRIPLEWYIEMLHGVRHNLGRPAPAYVFSDGTDAELAQLLAVPGCQRVTFGSAIADLWALSNANLLVASGSTFSMWASYLGRMPVIWHPGQLRCRLYAGAIFEHEIAQASDLKGVQLA